MNNKHVIMNKKNLQDFGIKQEHEALFWEELERDNYDPDARDIIKFIWYPDKSKCRKEKELKAEGYRRVDATLQKAIKQVQKRSRRDGRLKQRTTSAIARSEE